jgi:hypothetical protein
MSIYIAFLRGINVGGKHPLPMKELVAVLEDLGAQNVKTYILMLEWDYSPSGTRDKQRREPCLSLNDEFNSRSKVRTRIGSGKKHGRALRAVWGVPPKRHYVLIAGSEDFGTMVWQREWESFAVMEAAYDRMFADSEAQQLGQRAQEIYDGERIEYYSVQ